MNQACILIVDDDPNMSRTYTDILAHFGHTAISARSGLEAIRWLQDQQIDLVLLDLRLPGMSGLEVLAEMRARNWNTAVILASAYPEEQAETEALRLGALKILQKPVNLDDLLATISDL